MTTMTSKIIWALLLSLQASLCAGQDKPNPIDQWLARAIQKDSSTAGVRDATNVARQKWAAQLNKWYLAATLCVLLGWLIYLEGGFAEAAPGGPGRLLVLSFCADRSVVAEPLPWK